MPLIIVINITFILWVSGPEIKLRYLILSYRNVCIVAAAGNPRGKA